MQFLIKLFWLILFVLLMVFIIIPTLSTLFYVALMVACLIFVIWVLSEVSNF